MPGKHSKKQKRQAKHVAASERKRGKSPEGAERIGWATVNSQKADLYVDGVEKSPYREVGKPRSELPKHLLTAAAREPRYEGLVHHYQHSFKHPKNDGSSLKEQAAKHVHSLGMSKEEHRTAFYHHLARGNEHEAAGNHTQSLAHGAVAHAHLDAAISTKKAEIFVDGLEKAAIPKQSIHVSAEHHYHIYDHPKSGFHSVIHSSERTSRAAMRRDHVHVGLAPSEGEAVKVAKEHAEKRGLSWPETNKAVPVFVDTDFGKGRSYGSLPSELHKLGERVAAGHRSGSYPTTNVKKLDAAAKEHVQSMGSSSKVHAAYAKYHQKQAQGVGGGHSSTNPAYHVHVALAEAHSDAARGVKKSLSSMEWAVQVAAEIENLLGDVAKGNKNVAAYLKFHQKVLDHYIAKEEHGVGSLEYAKTLIAAKNAATAHVASIQTKPQHHAVMAAHHYESANQHARVNDGDTHSTMAHKLLGDAHKEIATTSVAGATTQNLRAVNKGGSSVDKIFVDDVGKAVGQRGGRVRQYSAKTGKPLYESQYTKTGQGSHEGAAAEPIAHHQGKPVTTNDHERVARHKKKRKHHNKEDVQRKRDARAAEEAARRRSTRAPANEDARAVRRLEVYDRKLRNRFQGTKSVIEPLEISKAMVDVLHYAKKVHPATDKVNPGHLKKLRSAAESHVEEVHGHLTASEHMARAGFHHEQAAQHVFGMKNVSEHVDDHETHYVLHRALERAHKKAAEAKSEGSEAEKSITKESDAMGAKDSVEKAVIPDSILKYGHRSSASVAAVHDHVKKLKLTPGQHKERSAAHVHAAEALQALESPSQEVRNHVNHHLAMASAHHEASRVQKSQTKESDDMGKFEEIFKGDVDQPAVKEQDKVLIACPHCEKDITRSQVIAKAKGEKIDLVKAGSAKNQEPTKEVAKSEATPDKKEGEEVRKGPEFVAGSEYFQWWNSGDDAYTADLISKGMVGKATRAEPPIDRLYDPRR